jgi:uncharacterized membrane protein
MSQPSESVQTNIESDRAIVLVAYVLHLIGSVAAVTSLIALLLNYLKRNETDSLLASHHDWMIRTFWWSLLWLAVGFITTILLIGWLIIALVWVWYVYRHVLGLIRLANGESMPV